MDARDLRIGNLIKIGGNTIDTYQTYKSTIVTIDILRAIFEENTERPNAILSIFQPIELTEEWLLKAAFIKNNYEADKFAFNEPFYKVELERRNRMVYYCFRIIKICSYKIRSFITEPLQRFNR
jgi:hypothetical protein